MSLTVSRYNSTAGFGAKDWDPFHKGDFYFSYDFLKVVEQAGVNNAVYRFLAFSFHGKPAGAAVLSSFQLHLDLLSGNPAIVRALKKLRPALFTVPVVCCGMPVSFGQNHFCVLNEPHIEAVLEVVQSELQHFADEQKCSLLAWKEFPADFKGMGQLAKEGYIKLNSLPDTQVFLPENGSSHFLRSVRSAYKRKLNRTAAALASETLPEGFSITLSPFKAEHAGSFFDGYAALMSRTPVKLEQYPLEFFELLAEHLAEQAQLLTLQNARGQSISALLILCEPELHFILVSKNRSRYDNGLYTELLRAITLYGVEKGVKRIKMGQTSYYSKMGAGARPVPLYIYLRSGNKLVQAFLRKSGRLLFPATPIPNVNFYKSNDVFAGN